MIWLTVVPYLETAIAAHTAAARRKPNYIPDGTPRVPETGDIIKILGEYVR